jgi:hypothetical protein
VIDLPFSKGVWFVDFEYQLEPGFFPAPANSTDDAGGNPIPVCCCAFELRSGRMIRVWQHELAAGPPYPTDASALFVGYNVAAEIGCHLALGWPVPERVLDLYVEFKRITNCGVKPLVGGHKLIHACAHFGIDTISLAEKQEMIALILRGGPWSEDEKAAILDYCQSDIVVLPALLEKILPRIDLRHALIRGRYMTAVARMVRTGTPIDTDMLELFLRYWPNFKNELISRVDVDYGVYVNGSFNVAAFEAYLSRNGIPWPRLDSGQLATDDDTFRQMAKAYPQVSTLRELRHSLSEMRNNKLAVGVDGRNRTSLFPFGTVTGRNAPSNSKYIFGPSVWLRGLIKPRPGYGIAYLDYSQQEFAVAAALSHDPRMTEAYRSGDPYLTFAKQAGAVPENATKQTHPAEREQFKQCTLAVNYMMGPKGLAQRIGQPLVKAQQLLNLHRRTYCVFWEWSERAVNVLLVQGYIDTMFGWRRYLPPGGHDINLRSMQNYLMQAGGAEMLRLACCLATERGIAVCAPVHDALLIEAPLERLDDDVKKARDAMREASLIVLDGFEVGTDAKIVRYPDRFCDEARGGKMWRLVTQMIAEVQEREQQSV